MLDIVVRKGLVRYHLKWFCAAPAVWDVARPVLYVQSSHNGHVRGFIEEPFSTIVIDLLADAESLLRGCKKQVRYEIRKAREEGIECQTDPDIAAFIRSYNMFADGKQIARLRAPDCAGFAGSLQITKAVKNGQTLVTHSYVVDRIASRARLLHSASLFRSLPSRERAAAGRANRFLHYEDMLLFKRQGLRRYDLGGYAQEAATSQLDCVNSFKAGFGGTLIVETNYLSLPLNYARLVRKGTANIMGHLRSIA